MDEQARYERAKKRVEEIKGFYSHLIVYVIVNIGGGTSCRDLGWNRIRHGDLLLPSRSR